MKKWIPFILILLVAVSSTFFLFVGGEVNYVPQTSDPEIIYKEACTGCHGLGEINPEFLTPNLGEEELLSTGVKNIVKNGTWRMPSFPAISDTVLDALAEYVANKKFLTE